MAGCVQLLSTCAIPRVSTRDGDTGADVWMNLIGIGFWSPSGATISFPRSTIAQDTSRTYQGSVKPDTFSKGFPCNVPAACPA